MMLKYRSAEAYRIQMLKLKNKKQSSDRLAILDFFLLHQTKPKSIDRMVKERRKKEPKKEERNNYNIT